MKKLLLLLVLVPGISRAQTELGINAGAAPVLLPLNNKTDFVNTFRSSGGNISPVAAVTLKFRSKKLISWGLSATAVSIKYDVSYNNAKYVHTGIKNVNEKFGNGSAAIGKPALPVQAFISANKSIGKNEYSVSASAGYALLLGSDIDAKSNLAAGAAVSLTHYVVPEIGLNVSAGLQYFRLAGSDYHYNIMTFPITVGVRFKL